MRDTRRIPAEIIDMFVKDFRRYGGLEEQPRVHDHILLAVDLPREVEYLIGEQLPLVEFRPWCRRQLPIEKRLSAGV